MAAIELLRCLLPLVSKLLITTDSDYCCSGIQGPVYKWKTANWCTQKGLVPNADFWKLLVNLLNLCHAQVQWIWVPSHVAVLVNERAHELAESGRNRSPLAAAPAPSTPDAPPPPCRRRTQSQP